MASNQLTRVIEHLQDISRRSLASRGDVEEKRRLVDEYFCAHPAIGEVKGNTLSVEVDGIPAEWVTSASSDPDRRLLYLHGGSWMAGRVERYRPHVARIAASTGCSVLAIDYRLAPQFPFPVGLNDCVAALQWMRSNGPSGAKKVRAVFIAGDSAGGNLALATLLICKDQQLPAPQAAVVMSAATDLSWTGESIQSRLAVEAALDARVLPLVTNFYLKDGADPRDPYVSPLFGDLAGLPPLLVQVGDAEILLDDSTRFAEKAAAAGVDVALQVFPEMPHVFQGFAPFLSEANDALDCIGEFVRRH